MNGGQDKAPRSLVAPETIQALLGVASLTPPGAFVEVGVYQGGTAWHLSELAQEQDRLLYLYDTFTGIPYKGEIDSHVIGDFRDTSADTLRQLLPYSIITEGIFPRSALPGMAPVAFVHLDCDQYQSYAEALAHLNPLMTPGGVIWCDDVPCLAGATAAVSEFAARTGRRLVTRADVGKTYIQF